jgi:hypothetical protein
MNELGRVLSLIESFRAAKASRRDFAEKNGLHPSALSRILRVGALPAALLDELASFERLSRTHLEVLAAAPEERRGALLAEVRAGRSTYRLRERRERTGAPRSAASAAEGSRASPPAEPARSAAAADAAAELGARLGASAEETRAFALELLSVLFAGSPGRVRSSLEQFRRARSAQRSNAESAPAAL